MAAIQNNDGASRGHFGSRFGFIMAAAGSAVGIGNIWGFPTQAASNGGGAFLMVYLFLIFLLGYPMLVAELMVGRHGQTNPADAMAKLGRSPATKIIGRLIGLASIICAVMIFSFYAILSGWFVSNTLAPIAAMVGAEEASRWLIDFSLSRNIVFTLVFTLMSIYVIQKGVQDGIEKWSKRLMPLLFSILIASVIYILFQPGASEGVAALFTVDFEKIMHSDVLIGALGQTFFSLSIGTGVMMIYGSYLKPKENISKLAVQVTFIDTGVAFLAAMLILPAMYVAKHNGVIIFDADGNLLSSDTLVFTVLPALFATMGAVEHIVAIIFFALMSVAALTSAISVVEVPTSYIADRTAMSRKKVTWIVGAALTTLAMVVVTNFDLMFGFMITLSTEIMQPLICLGLAIFTGWVWHRNSLLAEIKGQDGADVNGIFWKIWPLYVKFFCPVLIIVLISTTL
ncbi:MAG: sodium-dependent transporter [Moritella sp.]|uniref:sodium-dependent transporter n=1 Tax=unclassified Moritella TaxID=2637987 RepID=UPI0001568452|nr:MULTISPECIES: sodium-dependent transporter [unclassified Moritella]EDM68838.1 sodium-dependent transporter, putative [Moritella sp. PE36]MBL1415427.1 sodium-dependent transporter [Moritella sp.]